MRRALSETVVKGITTNTRYLRAILDLEEFRRGDYDTGLLSRAADRLLPEKPDGKQLTPDQEVALAAATIWQLERDQPGTVAPAARAEPESAWARAGRLEALRRNA